MMDTSKLQFNIIFTPFTVEYLSPFIHSLLKWTDCQYRIVNNGCGPKEQAVLRDLCATDERLEYLSFSEDEMLQHGVALNWLLERTDSPWFCFMDSDILATGPYLESIAKYMDNYDIFSSGYPLWYAPEDITLPEHFRRLHGIHFDTSDGKRLGGTYFAVCDKDKLTAAIESMDVDFQIYRWEQVPERHRKTLTNVGLDKLEYDTGMLLMSLMHAYGARFASENIPDICHLGGFSSRAGDEPAFYYRGKADRIAVEWLGGRFAVPLLFLADSWYAYSRPSPGVTVEENKTLPFHERRMIEARIRKRRNTARYFKALMQSLQAGTPPPQVPVLGHPPAERRIADAAIKVAEIYRDYAPLAAQGLAAERESPDVMPEEKAE
jgi:hypothetical protein